MSKSWDQIKAEAFGTMLPVEYAKGTVTFAPGALRDLKRLKLKLRLLAMFHPFAAKRAECKSALRLVEGIERGMIAHEMYRVGAALGASRAKSAQ